jgi:hypothetical protein
VRVEAAVGEKAQRPRKGWVKMTAEEYRLVAAQASQLCGDSTDTCDPVGVPPDTQHRGRAQIAGTSVGEVTVTGLVNKLPDGCFYTVKERM